MDSTAISRRQLLALGAGAVAASAGARFVAWPQDAVSAGATAPPGTPFPLVALDGKAPLGQVYDQPPNYETPTSRLIGRRNPPYTDTEDYYVRYREADVYRVDPDRFRLRVGGEAATEQIDLSMADLRDLPTRRVGTVGACAGLGRGLVRPLVPGMPWTKGDVSCGEWTGVPLEEVLRLAGARPDASVVAFRGGRTIAAAKRDYWRHWDLESMNRQGPLLAYELNGEPLPVWNGFPLRVVVPGTYAPGWVKQVVEIDIRRTPHPRDWRGNAPGTPLLKPMSLIVEPTDGSTVQAGATVALRGVAWDHGTGLRRVDVSVDDGRSWIPARMERSVGRYAWRVFEAKVPAGDAGTLRVLSRAESRDGTRQPLDIPEEVMADGVRKNTAARTFAAVLEVRG
ncbi:molybdopterin-dependent oxidoreductase [Paraconexibacter sp.]|uniref:molybdopterin-dependent oxidoreductase n=1 Tax=Paraconexibacter sp. TaxID=2949640 RepID=UPI003568DB44